MQTPEQRLSEIVEELPLMVRLGVTVFTREMAYLILSNAVHMGLVTVLFINLGAEWLTKGVDLSKFNLNEMYSFFGITYFIFSGCRDAMVQPLVVIAQKTNLDSLLKYRHFTMVVDLMVMLIMVFIISIHQEQVVT